MCCAIGVFSIRKIGGADEPVGGLRASPSNYVPGTTALPDGNFTRYDRWLADVPGTATSPSSACSAFVDKITWFGAVTQSNHQPCRVRFRPRKNAPNPVVRFKKFAPPTADGGEKPHTPRGQSPRAGGDYPKTDEVDPGVRVVIAPIGAAHAVTNVVERAAPQHATPAPAILAAIVRHIRIPSMQAIGPFPHIARHVQTAVGASAFGILPHGRDIYLTQTVLAGATHAELVGMHSIFYRQ